MTLYPRDQVEALTDKELIVELRRRGRLRTIEASGMYYTDMKDDDGYMRHCDHGIVALIVRALRTKLIAQFVDRRGVNPNVTIRNGSVVVLLSRAQAELERHEAAKSSEAVSGVPAKA